MIGAKNLSAQNQEKNIPYHIGEIVLYNEKEWIIADQHGKRITLYRETVDGSSETVNLTERELQKLLKRYSD